MGENVWQAIWDWLLTSGLRIAFIFVVGLIASRWLRVLSARLERLIAGVVPTEDEARRASTLTRVIHSTALVTIVITAGLMIMRELGLDIAPLIAGCQFSDCTHTVEPGCAVMDAVEADEVSFHRYESYVRLRDEHQRLADMYWWGIQ